MGLCGSKGEQEAGGWRPALKGRGCACCLTVSPGGRAPSMPGTRPLSTEMPWLYEQMVKSSHCLSEHIWDEAHFKSGFQNARNKGRRVSLYLPVLQTLIPRRHTLSHPRGGGASSAVSDSPTQATQSGRGAVPLQNEGAGQITLTDVHTASQ